MRVERSALGITILLSYVVFMLMVADTVPRNSDYIPILRKINIELTSHHYSILYTYLTKHWNVFTTFTNSLSLSSSSSEVYLFVVTVLTALAVITSVLILRLFHISDPVPPLPPKVRHFLYTISDRCCNSSVKQTYQTKKKSLHF